EAQRVGHKRLRVTTGPQNEPMRALARKFGAHLHFAHGELAGSIDLTAPTIRAPQVYRRARNLPEAVLAFNPAYSPGVITMGDAMGAARDKAARSARLRNAARS